MGAESESMAGWYIYVGLATVFVAVFALFFIFHTLEQLAAQCKEDPSSSPLCGQLNMFSMSMLIVLLIIGGFVVTITATAYIMISAG